MIQILSGSVRVGLHRTLGVFQAEAKLRDADGEFTITVGGDSYMESVEKLFRELRDYITEPKV